MQSAVSRGTGQQVLTGEGGEQREEPQEPDGSQAPRRSA
jgi:hypothetical protein